MLRALDEVPREHFVERAFVDAAYADQALPIACGQTISQPYVVAYMTEQLDVQPEHRVLEIGTGSGYQAADSVAAGARGGEHRALSYAGGGARACGWRRSAIDNVEVRVGDGLAGVPERAPYDRIIVTAAAETVPQALVEQLAEDGVMVLPLGPHDGNAAAGSVNQGCRTASSGRS